MHSLFVIRRSWEGDLDLHLLPYMLEDHATEGVLAPPIQTHFSLVQVLGSVCLQYVSLGIVISSYA
jgi:hypothetical protein